MSFAIHILDSTNALTPWRKVLSELSTKAFDAISKELPIKNVDVVFYVNPKGTIPEVGMCGYAATENTVLMSLDPDNPHFESSLETELPGTLAHEFHHCMRISGVGYGKTLLEALITEGLARDFEKSFRGNQLPSYHRIFSHEELESLKCIANKEYFNKTYNHYEWFFNGSTKKQIPQFAGYSLGYELVREHLSFTESSSAALWNEPAQNFIV